MRKVILYIAVSLDGYIADSEGSVEWISGQDKNVEMEDTFTPFFSGVDTVIMGKRTYDQIVTELSPDQWPYGEAMTYVLTHHSEEEGTENIRFRNMDVCQLVEELKQESGKDVWICGGAEVAQQLIANNQIDIYHLAIIPVLLFSSLGHPNFKIGWPYRSNHKVYVVPHPFQVSSPRPAWIEHECS